VQRLMNSLLKNRARICVSVLPRDTEEARHEIHRAMISKAGIVELRLDNLASGSAANLLPEGQPPKPLILTLLESKKAEEECNMRLVASLAPYACYADLPSELLSTARMQNPGLKIIRSAHFQRSLNYTEAAHTLEELKQDADIAKLVFTAESVDDNVTALTLARVLKFPKVVFCMGSLGILSRVLTPFFGSEWTYASLEPGLESAPGQLDVATLSEIYDGLGE
jgi:3-dehydroquinate dehydratase/shikimate dehydrogenase